MNKRPSRRGDSKEAIIRTLLVDGNGLLKQSYNGAKHMYNSRGQHIGGLYQFLTTLRKLIKERSYHKVLVFWDGEFSGKLRNDVYPIYKETRNKDYVNGTKPVEEDYLLQRFKIDEYLDELGIKQYSHPIVEADDLIAHYVKNNKFNEKIVISTNDRDICQLIDDNVILYLSDLKRYFDRSAFKKQFNYPSDNVKLIKILTGDTSDNIKGVELIAQATLFKLFPEVKNDILTVDDIIAKAKILQNNRLESGKTRLKNLQNIIDGKTKGPQGDKLYEINDYIINLLNPLLTEDCINELDEIIEEHLDMTDRKVENIYEKIIRDGLNESISSNYMVEYLLPYKEYNERYKKLIN